MQTLANKQHYWKALTLVRLNGVYVGMAEIDSFMKGINDFSNDKVHLKTSCGHLTIVQPSSI